MASKKNSTTAKLDLTIDTGDVVVFDLIDPDTGYSKIHVAIDQEHYKTLNKPDAITIMLESQAGN